MKCLKKSSIDTEGILSIVCRDLHTIFYLYRYRVLRTEEEILPTVYELGFSFVRVVRGRPTAAMISPLGVRIAGLHRPCHTATSNMFHCYSHNIRASDIMGHRIYVSGILFLRADFLKFKMLLYTYYQPNKSTNMKFQ